MLLVHLGAIAAAALFAVLWFDSGLRFPTCAVNRFTGLYCLTCGATRAAYELAHLRLLRSALLNPVPLLAALMTAYTLACEAAGVFLGRRIRVRGWFGFLMATLAVAAVYCVLRNFGLVPAPEIIFP
ncbi:MAG: DUF2752 domain-containing protein [Oscillospiraceae bacterium]|nr:DUF2752 domain-containing protein [Oscillospiraceae bacterium]